MRLNNKLDYKFLGLFRITKKLSDINYKLDLLLGIRIYPIFYIIFLKSILLNAKLKTNIKFINKLLEYKIKAIIDS